MARGVGETATGCWWGTVKLVSCLVAAKIGGRDRCIVVVQGTPVPAGDHRPLRVAVSPVSAGHGQVNWLTYRPRVVRRFWWKALSQFTFRRRRGNPGDLVPDGEAVGHLVAPSVGRQQMPPRTEMWRDAAERGPRRPYARPAHAAPGGYLLDEPPAMTPTLPRS